MGTKGELNYQLHGAAFMGETLEQLVEKFLSFYGSRKFISMLTTAHLRFIS
jgi:hypothetical protein